MQSPKTWGQIQSLSGKLAALNRFLSWSAEKSLPFFKTLKNITKENKDDYRWTEEAEKAFQELKEMVLNLPSLTTIVREELMYVYLDASREACHQGPGPIGLYTEVLVDNESIVPRCTPHIIDQQMYYQKE
nr:reverse transcriptase domain-containing protein [Tanacetum cinerariifolium]